MIHLASLQGGVVAELIVLLLPDVIYGVLLSQRQLPSLLCRLLFPGPTSQQMDPRGEAEGPGFPVVQHTSPRCSLPLPSYCLSAATRSLFVVPVCLVKPALDSP